MAEIEIAPLSQRLGDEEIEEIEANLQDLGAPDLPHQHEEGSHVVADAVDEDGLAEFLDRLEAHDMACEIYLPVEFDGRFEVADLRVGSLPLLVEALEELREDLALDEGDDEEEVADEDDDESILDAKLRGLWRLFYKGATLAAERRLPLHVTV